MQDPKSLLVVGLANAEFNYSITRTKGAISKYLESLNRVFDVTWCVGLVSGRNYNQSVSLPPWRIVHLHGTVFYRLWLILGTLTKTNFNLALIDAYHASMLWILMIIRGIPYAVYVGNNFFDEYWNTGSTRYRIKGLLQRYFILLALRHAAAIIVRGSYLTTKIKHLLPKKNVYETSPMTSLLAKSAARSITKSHYLFVGNLSKEKGFPGLLDAFDVGFERGVLTLPLVIIGSDIGGFSERLRKKPYLQYFGYIDDPDRLANYYVTAAAVLVPSTLESREGVPRVIDEALHFGAPVIASPILSVIREFGNSILYFSSLTPSTDNIIDVILTVEESRRNCYLRSDLPRAARTSAAEQHLKILSSMVK